MNYRPAVESEQTRNITDPAVAVTGVLVEFKTGDKLGAGTDADVFLRIGDVTFPMPEEHGKNPFERRALDRFGFGLDPAMSLAELRRSEIEVYHNSSGSNPGWLIERIRIALQLTGQGDQPLEYKVWNDVGWLAVDEPPNSTQVLLQQRE
jgi:hypothetical protein